MTVQIHLVQLYPRQMNIYGDHGNVLTLRRQLEWRGFEPIVHDYNPGDRLPERVDIIIGGGGQDSGQSAVQTDLLALRSQLSDLAEAETPMLMICGLYQMFGHRFDTVDGQSIDGIGLLDVTTVGQTERFIGNIVTQSSDFGRIIGYENHSGRTMLGPGSTPLGTVVSGAGNNGEDGTEGARSRNVLGSYLHGSLLPKNPALSAFLIDTALRNRGIDPSESSRADVSAVPSPSSAFETASTLAQRARTDAGNRPR